MNSTLEYIERADISYSHHLDMISRVAFFIASISICKVGWQSKTSLSLEVIIMRRVVTEPTETTSDVTCDACCRAHALKAMATSSALFKLAGGTVQSMTANAMRFTFVNRAFSERWPYFVASEW